jgi:hypothetical protein
MVADVKFDATDPGVWIPSDRRPPALGVAEVKEDITPDGGCGSSGALREIMSSKESSEESLMDPAEPSVSDSSAADVTSISVPLSPGLSSAAE